jgi:hypothetical protein
LPIVGLLQRRWHERMPNLKIPNLSNEMRLSMITNQVLTNESNPGSGQETPNIQRRTFIGGALGAALLSFSGQVLAQGNHVPNDPFIVLLKGLYQPVPVGQGPNNNLGLSSVNLNDGSYSKTRIYPVWIGIPGSQNQDKAIGTFYVSPVTNLCAYDLPRGAIAMQFIPGGTFPVVVPDGMGGQYDEGTLSLTILEATGIYRAFGGGHNIMVDKLHQLVAGPPLAGFPDSGYDEFCFCIISQYPFP